MAQSSSDKFLHFTVNLLKGSAALDALRDDAVKHHMIDNPGQLIALRLTEYYEMMTQGVVQPVIRVPAVAVPVGSENGVNNVPVEQPHASPVPSSPSTQSYASSVSMQSNDDNGLRRQLTGGMRALGHGDEIVSTAATDQNADDAADYWGIL
ncbi:MAG TPA: hypothetical protein VL461_07025 [Dictyobacter sp.]|jgi:hypothetical protein|nr:hypothetical protein [Dictyobacter sp.]